MDALNKLDEYRNVFDVDYYKAHKNYYYKRLIVGTLQKNDMYAGVYPLLKKKISLTVKIVGLIQFLAKLIFPLSIKKIIKKIIGK